VKGAELAAAGVRDVAAGRRRGRLHRAVNDLTDLLAATRRIAVQTRQRLSGSTPEGATRRVSLHDGDARPIAKGRLGRPVEFGYKGQVVDNDDGVVLDHTVERGNPADAPHIHVQENLAPHEWSDRPRSANVVKGLHVIAHRAATTLTDPSAESPN
jgi:IS5 family transposase